jgi:hypothetical protein
MTTTTPCGTLAQILIHTMNPPTAICPGCRQEVAFQSAGATLRRCPLCGFQYEVLPPVTSSGSLYEPSSGSFLGTLFKGLLIVVVLIVVGVGVLFAGCALAMRGL